MLLSTTLAMLATLVTLPVLADDAAGGADAGGDRTGAAHVTNFAVLFNGSVDGQDTEDWYSVTLFDGDTLHANVTCASCDVGMTLHDGTTNVTTTERVSNGTRYHRWTWVDEVGMGSSTSAYLQVSATANGSGHST